MSHTQKKAEVPGTCSAATMAQMHRRLRSCMVVTVSNAVVKGHTCALYSGTKTRVRRYNGTTSGASLNNSTEIFAKAAHTGHLHVKMS